MALILAISDSKEYQFLNKNAELHGKISPLKRFSWGSYTFMNLYRS